MNEYDYYSENTGERKKKKLSGMGTIISLFLLFPLVPFFFITGMSVLAVYSFEFDERRSCTYETEATVVEYETREKHRNNRVKYQYTPVYSYAYEEREYKAEGIQSLPKKKYEIGDRTTIFVNPDNPEEILDKNYSLMRADNNSFIVLFGIFSVLLIADIVFFICHKIAYERQVKESNNN